MRIKICILCILCIISLPFIEGGKVEYKIKSTCMKYPKIQSFTYNENVSDSMYPAFTCKDTILINSINSNDIVVVGKVYCYRPDYRNFYIPAYFYVCHRLINVTSYGLKFKGDNNLFEDPIVDRRYVAYEILGKEVMKNV